MSFARRWDSIAVVCLLVGLVAAHFTWGQAVPNADSQTAVSQKKDRARIVISQSLPKLDGDHLKVILVEVNYGPGEASSPHSHPCAVIGYVAEGALRTQVKGEPERTYGAGESFFEPPNGVHLVSANASSTKPAKLVAYLICDREAPLSIDVPENILPKGASR